ncbi:MAG: hypothetical protein GX891_03785 [Clostridiales bacterium]|nr:hypothetical protein [Clostridiales bacterium]
MKLIYSDDTHGAIRAVCERVKEEIKKDESYIVLVPDRFSMNMEKRLLETLNIKSSFNVEVLTFTRLAGRLLGKRVKRCLTPEGSVMLLHKVIKENKDNLTYFRRAALKPGFAREFYAALTSLRNSGVTPYELRSGAERAQKSLKGKLFDIALIYEQYLKKLGDSYIDSSTRLEALKEELDKTLYLPENFYVCGFSTFKAPEFAAIERIAEKAKSLTVALAVGVANKNSRIFPKKTLYDLKRLDKNADVSFKSYNKAPRFDFILKNLFSYEKTKPIASDGKIKLIKSPDIQSEAKAAAIRILKAVMEEGLRYKDIAVAVTDLDERAPEIQSVFERFGIPFFIDINEPLKEQAKVSFILSAIRCVTHNFSLSYVLEFVKNPLFGLEPFDFENYCLKYSIDYTRFLSPFVLGGSEAELPEIARKNLVSLLRPFMGQISSANDFKKAIDDFLSLIKPSEAKYLDELAKVDERRRAAASQIDGKIDELLDELCLVLGETELDLKELSEIFTAAVNKTDIALIPLYLDCVFVGSVYDSIFETPKILIVMGAEEGKLPLTEGGGVIINRADEETLNALGCPLYPDTRERNFISLLKITELLASPEDELILSCSATAPDGKELRPSQVYLQFLEFFEGVALNDLKKAENELILSSDDEIKAEKMSYLFATKESALYEIFEKYVSGEVDDVFAVPFISAAETVDKKHINGLDTLYKIPVYISLPEKVKARQSTSASRLERFLSCPYSHFLSYVLMLKKREESSLLSTETGTIIHAVLEKYFDPSFKSPLSGEERALSIFSEVISLERYKAMLSGEFAHRIERLKNEAVRVCLDLDALLSRSRFKPFMVEATFAKREGALAPPEVEVDGRKIAIEGKIDRIDKFGDYAVIIDYKTFKSAELDFKHIYFGKKLQLYIYLYAVEQNFNLKPAGVFYLPIYAQFVKDTGKNRYLLSGQVLDEPEILKALDSDVISPDTFLPVGAGNRKTKNMIKAEDFEALKNYALDISKRALSEISKGYIKPSPLENECDRCDFALICSYKSTYQRKTPAVDKEAFINGK